MTIKLNLFLLFSQFYFIFCQNKFYTTFLKWQFKSRQHMDFDRCFALNFGFGSSLEIPTFSMRFSDIKVDQNETDDLPLHRDMLTSASESCLLVFVGEQILDKIDEISKMTKQISREVGTEPTALFANAKRSKNITTSHLLYYPLVRQLLKLMFTQHEKIRFCSTKAK